MPIDSHIVLRMAYRRSQIVFYIKERLSLKKNDEAEIRHDTQSVSRGKLIPVLASTATATKKKCKDVCTKSTRKIEERRTAEKSFRLRRRELDLGKKKFFRISPEDAHAM